MIGTHYQQNLLSTKQVFSHWDPKDSISVKVPPISLEPPKPEAERIQIGSIFLAHLYHYNRFNNFYFRLPQFDSQVFAKMHLVTKITYQTGYLMYAARPYTTKVGDMKLFLDHKGRLYRCTIKDLYPENYNGTLKMKTSIELIDKRISHRGVDFDYIYDIPNIIEHIRDLESELKEARLYFGQPDNYHNDEVDEFFRRSLKTSGRDRFEIKIMDDRDGVYHVDILSNGSSMLDYMRNRFPDKLSFPKAETIGPCKLESKLNGIMNFTPTNRLRRSIVDISLSKNDRQQHFTYDGALDYFKKKIYQIKNLNSKSVLEPRFFSVKVISWSDPDSFYIIPNDRDYLLTHHKYMIEQERSLEFTRAFTDPSKLIVSYELGQICYFLNTVDIKLGKWLRGVIVGVPAYDGSGHLSSDSLDNATNKMDILDKSRIWSSGSDDPDLVIYKVQSVDYGFICARSAINLRRVPNDREFRQRGAWALRCRLFGIHPQSHMPGAEKRLFAPTCLSLIDGWVRERTLDEGKLSSFHLLFRTDLTRIKDRMRWPNPTIEISLFYRHEPAYRPEDCLLPVRRKPRYECLNNFLVQRGVASDFNLITGNRTRVDLDEFTVNLLVEQDLI